MMKRILRTSIFTLLAVSTVAGAPASAQTAMPDLTWRGTLYLWLPSVRSSAQEFPAGSGNVVRVETDPDGYLENLEFAFMGALEARQGPWSGLLDAIYLNFGDTKSRIKSVSGPLGVVAGNVQADVETDLEGFVTTLAAGYAISRSASDPTDMILGLRYLRVKPEVAWTLGGPLGTLAQSGTAELSESFTDAIVGVRGRASINPQWFVPYHVDIGTGSSRFTWQALAGIGYRFGWGDVTGVYRHLSYDFKNDERIEDIRFSGFAVGVSFMF